MYDLDEYAVSKILKSLKRDHQTEELNIDEVVKMASNISKKCRKYLEVPIKPPRMAQYDMHIAMDNLSASPKHNICAYLNPTTKYAADYAGIINFLNRSRIQFAISKRYDAYLSHQRLFWSNARIDCERNPPAIVGNISGREVVISEQTIREALHFEDVPEDPIVLDPYLITGCFLRMKYDGSITEGLLNKANLSPQYKYLMHVLVHCLSTRREGFDVARETLQSAMVALVLNLPYNFSGMIFNHLKENITSKHKKEKLLMYPRFLQMMFDVQHADLPKSNIDKIKFKQMTDITLNRLQSYCERPRIPPTKRLICHLMNPEYIPPPNNRWRNDNSDSNEENIVVPPDIIALSMQ